MGYTPDDYRRAGHRLHGARVLRNLRWRNRGVFAAEVGISLRTVADVETGRIGKRRYWDPGTIAILEHAVGWKAGSYEAILKGGDPTALDDREPELPEEVVIKTRDILDNPNITEEMREEMLEILLDLGTPRGGKTDRASRNTAS